MSEMTVWRCLVMCLSIVVAMLGVLVAYLTRRQLRSEEEATRQWVRIQDLFRQVSAMKARQMAAEQYDSRRCLTDAAREAKK